MAIEIKEYIGNHMNIASSSAKMFMNLSEGYQAIDPIHKESIMQDIEGIHVGPTRNFTWYMEEALDSSIPSWTKPYQRPLIMHHNEKDGKIIGRVVHAEKITTNTRSGTPALVFTCNVPDKDGKEQIQDGRLKTTSIGVIAHDVRCSICNKQIELDEEGFPECGHVRGSVYRDEVCYWKIYKMEAKELSYVIVPSDIYAHNIRTYNPEPKDLNMKENLELNEGVLNDMTIPKSTIEPKEGQTIDETVKDGAKVAEPVAEPKAEPATEPKAADPIVPKAEPTIDPKDKEIEDLKKELVKVEAEKVTIAKSLEEIKISLADAVISAEKATSNLGVEVALKESVESELIAIKVELRETAEDNLNSLRASLNKGIIAKESLSTRSFESIKDSILDMREELTGLAAVRQIAEATDPTIQNKENIEKNKEKTKLNVNESNSVGNIDLEEGVKDLMARFLL